MPERNGFLNRTRRLLRYRLVIPVLRGRQSPEYAARGVLIGLLIAMTPTIGIQMPIVFLLWLAVRAAFPAWGFNVVVAMAYTWVSNIFTAAPLYYGFLLTGNVMMGRWDLLSGYGAFHDRLDELLAVEADHWEALWVYMVGIFDLWGAPMFVGCIPWAILSAWLGYRWSLRLVIRFRARRLRRLISTR